MSELFSLALGQNSPTIKKAMEQLPDASRYFLTKRTGTINVVLFNKDHGIEALDRIDVMFKAEMVEDRVDQTGERQWVFIKVKPLSVMEGYDPVDYDIVPIKFVKPKRAAITAGAQKLINLYKLDWSDIDGSGNKGKIKKKDVIEYLVEEMDISLEEIEEKTKAKETDLPVVVEEKPVNKGGRPRKDKK